jgi:hypothetical protein
MSKAPTYNQGGDAQAIKRVANSYYGSYKNMFEEHGWPERGEKMMLAGQSRVVEDYGSVLKFEEAHRSDGIMFPMEAIYSDPPNVWLTSFYGFNPEKWGMLGFTLPEARDSFLNRSQPGALVVVYGSGEAAKDELGKVIGIQQCSHVTGNAENFIAPPEWIAKSRDLKKKEQWNFAVRAEKAWRVTPSSRMNVRDFAPKATETGAWQHIGAYGVPLTKSEALNILKLGLQEVEVYGRDHIFSSASGTAREILAPSKAGPVSQNPYVVKEAEGPKHLYILSLQGDADAFLGKPSHGKKIIKAGFSRDPQVRCAEHNRTLPDICAFHWKVIHSGALSGISAYPSSHHAKAGERAMQTVLCTEPQGRSLGGEFFLAETNLIDKAWGIGNATARDHKV